MIRTIRATAATASVLLPVLLFLSSPPPARSLPFLAVPVRSRTGGAVRPLSAAAGSAPDRAAEARRARRGRRAGGVNPAPAAAPPSPAGGSTDGPPPGRIYARPDLYDAAFGYRDFQSEAEFLLRCHVAHRGDGGGAAPVRVLELAAGPARHALEALAVGDAEGTGGWDCDGEDMGLVFAGGDDDAGDYVSDCVSYDEDTVVDYDGYDDDGADGPAPRSPADGPSFDEEWPVPAVSGAVAVDLSEEMAAYCTSTVLPELLPAGLESRFRYVVDDMKTLEQTRGGGGEARFDTAWLLLGSAAHLLTNGDFVSCLSVLRRELLSDGGTVVLELPHPQETFRVVDCSESSWEVPVGPDGGEEVLRVTWGEDDDDFDPVAQVVRKSVTLAVREGGGVREVVPMRLYTSQEVDALAAAAGYEVAMTYGAMDGDVSMDDPEDAHRMVCVLRVV